MCYHLLFYKIPKKLPKHVMEFAQNPTFLYKKIKSSLESESFSRISLPIPSCFLNFCIVQLIFQQPLDAVFTVSALDGKRYIICATFFDDSHDPSHI